MFAWQESRSDSHCDCHIWKNNGFPPYGNAIRPTCKVTFGSRPQSLPQSSHPEHTNQHTVSHSQQMGLSQIIAKGIRLWNWKGKATNNNKCYLFFTGTLIAPICQIQCYPSDSDKSPLKAAARPFCRSFWGALCCDTQHRLPISQRNALHWNFEDN